MSQFMELFMIHVIRYSLCHLYVIVYFINIAHITHYITDEMITDTYDIVVVHSSFNACTYTPNTYKYIILRLDTLTISHIQIIMKLSNIDNMKEIVRS